jgi:endonuclease/exonuclease/phosphatase family metal-dependent hydrolase
MSRTVRVVTANAAGGRDRRGRAGPEQWVTWCRSAGALGADVLAVQEVDHLLPRSGRHDQTAVLAAELGGSGAPWHARFAAAVHGIPGSRDSFRPASPGPATEPSYGVALLSRHPVRRWRELRLAPSRCRLPVPLPPGSRRRLLWVPDEPRVAVAAVVAAPGGDLTVVATHLSFAPWHARRQLREVVAWCADLPRPLVLAGDLNLPRSVAHRVTGWAPALRAATFPAHRPRWQPDHLLLDGLRAEDAATSPVGDSDHLAVSCTVRLPAPPSVKSRKCL